MFGLTNPKAYPVSAAMLLAAFGGFVLADLVIVFAAGLPAVRRLFARHAVAITRTVGVLFVAFGARSLAEAGRALTDRRA